jgi:hypothetical protein
MPRFVSKLFDGLAWIGDRMNRPFRPFLLWFMEETGLIRPIERIVEWLARHLPPEKENGS